jgi:electron transfer flavoprotein alpha subunit
VSVSLQEVPAAQAKRYVPLQDDGGVDIAHEDVLIGVGRGIKSGENVELADHLAQSLSGVLCGSRIAVDYGWLPLSRQVGCSGLTVKPRLYLAVGISGAPEHVQGMRDSGLIIAINTDPQAAIFDVAHYGVVADAIEFLPVLIDVIENFVRAMIEAHATRVPEPLTQD